MSAYVIVGFTPKDSDKLKEYSSSVPQTLSKYSGEMIAKGAVEQLHGEKEHAMQVIVGFPTRDDALSWYNSDEYQSIIPLRDQGMDAKFQLIG